MRVGDRHRALHESGFFDPCRPCHFAVAVQRKPAGENGIARAFAAREYHGYACAHWPLADLECPLAANQSCVADLYSRYVGEGVRGARISVEWHPEVTCAGLHRGRKDESCDGESD